MEGEEVLPVCATLVLVVTSRRPRSSARRRRPSVRASVAVEVRVGLVAAARVTAFVRIGRVGPTGRIVVQRITSRRRRPVSLAFVVAARRSIAVPVAVTRRAVGPRRAVVVLLRHVGTPVVGRSGAVPLARPLVLGLGSSANVSVSSGPKGDRPDRRDRSGTEGRDVFLTSARHVTRAPLNSRPSSFSTADRRSALVSYSTKLSGERRGSRQRARPMELGGPRPKKKKKKKKKKGWPSTNVPRRDGQDVPTTVAFAAGFGIDHVETGLTSKVLEILVTEHRRKSKSGERQRDTGHGSKGRASPKRQQGKRNQADGGQSNIVQRRISGHGVASSKESSRPDSPCSLT